VTTCLSQYKFDFERQSSGAEGLQLRVRAKNTSVTVPMATIARKGLNMLVKVAANLEQAEHWQ
jgi:hypothetical protein